MANYKPVIVQAFPKLGEKITKDTLYWKNYKTPIQIKEFGAVNKIDFSPVPPYNYAVTASSRIHIYGRYSQEPIKTFSRFKDVAYCATYREDGQLLVAGSEEGSVRIFDIGGRAPLRQFEGHTKAVRVVGFLSDKYRIMSGADDYTSRVWDVSTSSEIACYKEHTDYVRCGCTSKLNADLFVTGSYDHTVKVYDTRTDKSIMRIEHGQPVESVNLFPSEGLLVTAGGRYIKIWDILKGGQLLVSLRNHHKTPEDEAVVVGMTNGILNVKHRKHEGEKEVLHRRRPAYRTFVKGKNYLPKQEDLFISKPVKNYLKKYDKFLRTFQVSKALDAVLQGPEKKNPPEVTVAVMQELNRRGTLKNALAGRDEKQLSVLLSFLIRNVTDARYAPVLINVAEMIIDIYMPVIGQSSVIDKQFLKLQNLVEKEIDYQEELLEVLGMMDALFATMTRKKYSPVDEKKTVEL
ncbi:hypothetical protein Chor_007865 [Crotalus horridus]